MEQTCMLGMTAMLGVTSRIFSQTPDPSGVLQKSFESYIAKKFFQKIFQKILGAI